VGPLNEGKLEIALKNLGQLFLLCGQWIGSDKKDNEFDIIII
jgi:hypothetical protein